MDIEQEIAKANAKAKVLRKELASQITKTSKFGIVSEDLFQTQLEAFFDIAFNAGREVGMLECQKEVAQNTKDEILPREREGIQIIEWFAHFCFDIGDMFTLPDNTILQEAFLKYSEGICDDCGGAFDCDMCPVYAYRNNCKDFIDGKRTTFQKLIKRNKDGKKEG